MRECRNLMCDRYSEALLYPLRVKFGAGRIRPCRLYDSLHAVKAFDKAKGEQVFGMCNHSLFIKSYRVAVQVVSKAVSFLIGGRILPVVFPIARRTIRSLFQARAVVFRIGVGIFRRGFVGF